jgi:hypothetical protein
MSALCCAFRHVFGAAPAAGRGFADELRLIAAKEQGQ